MGTSNTIQRLRGQWFNHGFYDYLEGKTRKPIGIAKHAYFKGLSKARQMLTLWNRRVYVQGTYKQELARFQQEQREIEARMDFVRHRVLNKNAPRLPVGSPCNECSAAIMCRDYKLACNFFFHWAAKPAHNGSSPKSMPSKMYYDMTFKEKDVTHFWRH